MFLKNYIQINIGSTQLTANHNILQIVDVCYEEEKEAKYVFQDKTLAVLRVFWTAKTQMLCNVAL